MTIAASLVTAKQVADALHDRYDPIRAVTLIGRSISKALFAGQPDEVIFWAVVHVRYCGHDRLCHLLDWIGEGII
jgi:hypothetical protein